MNVSFFIAQNQSKKFGLYLLKQKLNVKFIPIVIIFLAGVFFIFQNQKTGNKTRESANKEMRTTEPAKKVNTFSEKATVVSTPEKVLQVKVVTKKNKIDSLIKFAKSLIGTPYKYASTDPSVGFDCSGFINYVFNHFNIKVPRSSRDFRNAGKQIALADSKPGDLILFTGTNPSEREIGHIGLIISNKDGITFIHSSSGKADGVVITKLNGYYRSRFVKVERVFFTN